MKVEIWSDYVCPFCYIGKRKFEAALESFKHKDQVELIFKSFELDPHAEKESEIDLYDTLAKKYGMSREQAKGMTNNVAAQAKEVGLDYDFDKMVRTNTFDAHRLTHFAAEKGKMNVIAERLLKAYFLDGAHIGRAEVLADVAEEVGLDRDEALNVLKSDAYSEHVKADIDTARQIGVSGVPFFVFDQKYAVSGAQPTEVFAEVLEKVWEENHKSPLVHVGGKDAAACEGDNCDI